MSEIRIINPKNKDARVEVNGKPVPWPKVGQDLVIRVKEVRFDIYNEFNREREEL